MRFPKPLFATLFLAAVGLASCTGNDAPGLTATEEFRFRPDSHEGLVMVGLRSVSSTREPGIIGRSRTWRVVWSRFDRATGRFIEPFDDLTGWRDDCPLLRFNAFGCSDDHTQVEYQAMVARPGTYALRLVTWDIWHHSIYADNERTLLLDNSLPTLLKTEAIPWFTVGAGEIVYIGDYTFDAAEKPVTLRSIDRNDEALAQQRDKLPLVEGEVRFRGRQVAAKPSEFREFRGTDQSFRSYMNYLWVKSILD